MRGLGILLALVLALLASACGGSEATVEQAPQDAIVLAASKTNDAGTFKAEMSGTGDVAGQSIAMSGTGEFDTTQQSGSMAMKMSVAGQDIDMQLVYAFPIMYMRFPPELMPGLPEGKSWVKMDLEKIGRRTGIDFGQLMQSAQSDPSQGLQYLKGASDVQAVGDEDVRGVATTHYKGIVDLKSLADDNPELKAQIDKIVAASGVSRVPVEVWIDHDGFVRRMTQTLDGMTMTTELYDFGTAVSVEEPPANDVVDFSALMGQS